MHVQVIQYMRTGDDEIETWDYQDKNNPQAGHWTRSCFWSRG